MQNQERGTEVLSVAVDIQGAGKARPYVEMAKATYPNVVDSENQLAMLFGFKAVPNAIFVDDAGIIRYTKFGGFDIRRAEHRQLAERFVQSPDLAEIEQLAENASGFESEEALAHFRTGLAHYRAGNSDAALAEWRAGVTLEPDNWIFRKQIWAIENPDRFYAGDVDFAWQKGQIERGQ